MVKVLTLLLVLLSVSGCAGYTHMLNAIPYAEFGEFRYSRGGNFSTATISASNAWFEGGAPGETGTLVIGDATITVDYGPFVNFDVYIENWHRERVQ